MAVATNKGEKRDVLLAMDGKGNLFTPGERRPDEAAELAKRAKVIAEP